MNKQTLAAIPIVIATIVAVLLGFEEPFVFAVLLQYPPVTLSFLAGVAATVCFGFIWPTAVCGIIASGFFWLIGAEPNYLHFIGLVAFAVPFAFIQLLSDAARYILRFGRNLKNT